MDDGWRGVEDRAGYGAVAGAAARGTPEAVGGEVVRAATAPTGLAVRCRGVFKRFYSYEHRTTSLREFFVRTLLRRPIHVRRPVFEVRDLDLEIVAGESVALVGANGSGKTTTLRLIAGVYEPSGGVVESWGLVSAVIELGVGFHPELTGRENLALYAAVLGMSRSDIRERSREMLSFADIGEHVDMPVKYYSTGMSQRLAFAVASHVDPDILMLDEALAVGDEAFRRKCTAYLRRFHDSGGTLIMVTHDLESALELAPRTIWLEGGRIRRDGETGSVLEEYRRSMA